MLDSSREAYSEKQVRETIAKHSGQKEAAALLMDVANVSDVNGFSPEQEDVAIVFVTHALPDRPPLVQALKSIGQLAAFLPKPGSADPETVNEIEEGGVWVPKAATGKSERYFNRDDLRISDNLDRIFDVAASVGKFMILDIGGYFAEGFSHIASRYRDHFLGVIEDTQNGHDKYARALSRVTHPHPPVFSVAQSPLKEPEDYLIGVSMVFTADSILRRYNNVMSGKRALVMGYGKLGRSIAAYLASRNVIVMVWDRDNAKRVEALAHGHQIPSRDESLPQADLVFCATGNKSMNESDFSNLKHGAFVLSVTSAEDEFGLPDNPFSDHERLDMAGVGLTPSFSSGSMYKGANGKCFFFVRNGEAANFLHGAVVGSFIYLVQSEIVRLAAFLANPGLRSILTSGGEELTKERSSDGLREMCSTPRNIVASKWIHHFEGHR